jgi:hypothetical protein
MWNKKIIFLILSIIVSLRSFSQCAMCKASVESNLESNSESVETVGSGLNDGILYLMSVPYIAVVVFGLLWYLQNRKKQQV